MPRETRQQRTRRENQVARDMGFRNHYHYRKALAAAKAEGVEPAKMGRSMRGKMAAMAYREGLLRFEGRKGSRKRGRAIARYVADLSDDGGDVHAFLDAIGSPKKAKK